MHRQNGAHQERRRLKVDSTSVQTDAGNLPEDTNLTGPVVMELRIAGLVQGLGATELRGQESPERDALRRLT